MRLAPKSINLHDPQSVIDGVNHQLKKTLEEVRMSERIDYGRVNRLRFSGLPFCPVRWMINLPNTLHEHTDKVVDFGYKFFTSVGHTVHDVIQTSMFHSPHVKTLTDWKCLSCNKLHKLRERSPLRCGGCGSLELKREEHTVHWNGAVGHVDEVLLLDKPTKTVYILDYKTTSLKNINKQDPPGYLGQISSYALALKDQGYNVIGYGLVYLPRDNPFRLRLSPYVFDERAEKSARKRLTTWKSSFDHAASITTKAQMLKLLDDRPCLSGIKAAYSDCQYASSCAGCGSRPENMVFLMEQSFNRVKTFLPVKDLK